MPCRRVDNLHIIVLAVCALVLNPAFVLNAALLMCSVSTYSIADARVDEKNCATVGSLSGNALVASAGREIADNVSVGTLYNGISYSKRIQA